MQLFGDTLLLAVWQLIPPRGEPFLLLLLLPVLLRSLSQTTPIDTVYPLTYLTTP